MASGFLHSASEASVDFESSTLLTAASTLLVTPAKRERRKSPAITADASVQPPISPSSSLTDTTFEPSIDMMVNDFDDEATLNEEEAMADLESHNPDDEIATLREESEMPIEELLAKYSGLASMPTCASSSSGSKARPSSSRRRRAPKRQHLEHSEGASTSAAADVEEKQTQLKEREETVLDDLPELPKKPHRSHLMDLYPDESFGESPTQAQEAAEDHERFSPLQTLFEEIDGEEDEDTDTDSDDTRKVIMVGSAYQAEIPDGLSLYGDILPYENEDQLIWEPSQVSEHEVEDYLAKIQETRALAPPEEGVEGLAVDENALVAAAPITPPKIKPPSNPPVQPSNVSNDLESVVKDNEQALHLLVQCGYDFKEALRRKRLNVLPLSDTMSSWSEAECQKFEEGIQKFGKDFYQIRQNQVRTRTMRELVQFYYLWKKSERRDQSFALNDTIDHMDAFINEAGNGNGNGNGHCSITLGSNGHGNGLDLGLEKERRKGYSIMTVASGGGGGGNGGSNAAKRRGSSNLNLEDEHNEDGANVVNI